MNPSTQNLVLVAMAGGISPVTVAPYDTVSGYGVSDLSLDIPSQSTLINVTSSGSPLTTQNVVQFFNGEAFTSTTLHSAYGFKQTGFPQDYKFPSPAPSPMATTIAKGEDWFTGFVATEDTNGNECFSPTYKLTKGVYYFGDYGAYNSTNFRGIMVVGTPTPLPPNAHYQHSLSTGRTGLSPGYSPRWGILAHRTKFYFSTRK